MSKETIVAIARQVLAKEIDPLEGCRAIVRNQGGLSAEERDDPDLTTLVAIESETDDLPMGTVRDLWDSKALAQQDRRRAKYLSRVKSDLFKACRALIERFA